MKAYGWSADYVRKGLPGAQGWVYANWALEHEMTVWGALVERKCKGYIQQELDKLRKNQT